MPGRKKCNLKLDFIACSNLFGERLCQPTDIHKSFNCWGVTIRLVSIAIRPVKATDDESRLAVWVSNELVESLLYSLLVSGDRLF